MLTLFGYLVLLVASVGFFIWSIKKCKSDPYGEWVMGIIFSSMAVLAVLIVAFTSIGTQYSDTIYLPLHLDALNATIEQQSAYITAGVDGSIAQGLEGLEIKREIQQTIRDRNELIATILYRQRSPWYLFKPEMEE